MKRCGAGAVAAAAALFLAGCGTFESGKTDYKSGSQKLPPLEVPPDLTVPGREDRFQIPDAPQAGVATYSAYNAERGGALPAGSGSVLPQFDKLRVERDGNERWLIAPGSPEKLWPIVKDFWQKNGFVIKIDAPEIGVMETEWAENGARGKQDANRGPVGGAPDGFRLTGERDKFRTRLERGAQPDTTEIYISHRGVEEVYTAQSQDKAIWQPRPSDPGLEAEFLRRLLVLLGEQDARARAQLAPKKAEERAKLVQPASGPGMLELEEPFDRAWRRVGLVLDRMGFTVEDRDRSKGFYFVRYVDPEVEAARKKEESVFSKLMFWRSDPDPKAEQYRIALKDRQAVSEIQVFDKEGNPDGSDTARRILALLQNQLK